MRTEQALKTSRKCGNTREGIRVFSGRCLVLKGRSKPWIGGRTWKLIDERKGINTKIESTVRENKGEAEITERKTKRSRECKGGQEEMGSRESRTSTESS